MLLHVLCIFSGVYTAKTAKRRRQQHNAYTHVFQQKLFFTSWKTHTHTHSSSSPFVMHTVFLHNHPATSCVTNKCHLLPLIPLHQHHHTLLWQRWPHPHPIPRQRAHCLLNGSCCRRSGGCRGHVCCWEGPGHRCVDQVASHITFTTKGVFRELDAHATPIG